MGWTQPICGPCWTRDNPGRQAHRLLIETEEETCCVCGRSTFEGIYVRLDPATVLYPAVDR
jgi:hypothetical protein